MTAGGWGSPQEGNSADVALERFGRPVDATSGGSDDADALSAATAMQRLMHDRGAGPASSAGALGAGEPDLATLRRPQRRTAPCADAGVLLHAVADTLGAGLRLQC